MFVRLLKLPPEVRAALRPLEPHDRDPRRRALPDPGEGADDRLVGTDHPRVLRRHRGQRPLRARLRPSGSRTRARSAARCSAPSASSTTTANELPVGEAGVDLLRGRQHVRVPPRRGEDAREPAARRLVDARRHRLRRRRRLPLPHRPQGQHDHLGRRQHLPAGSREPAASRIRRCRTSPSSASRTRSSARR